MPVGAVWEGPWSPGGLVMLQASSHEQQAVFHGRVCPLAATWPSGPSQPRPLSLVHPPLSHQGDGHLWESVFFQAKRGCYPPL